MAYVGRVCNPIHRAALASKSFIPLVELEVLCVVMAPRRRNSVHGDPLESCTHHPAAELSETTDGHRLHALPFPPPRKCIIKTFCNPPLSSATYHSAAELLAQSDDD